MTSEAQAARKENKTIVAGHLYDEYKQ